MLVMIVENGRFHNGRFPIATSLVYTNKFQKMISDLCYLYCLTMFGLMTICKHTKLFRVKTRHRRQFVAHGNQTTKS